MPIKVRKRDGRLEDFDKRKIVTGAVGSGCSFEEAKKLADQVMVWAESNLHEGAVDSSEVRIKVLELMRSSNPVAASSFETYRKK